VPACRRQDSCQPAVGRIRASVVHQNVETTESIDDVVDAPPGTVFVEGMYTHPDCRPPDLCGSRVSGVRRAGGEDDVGTGGSESLRGG